MGRPMPSTALTGATHPAASAIDCTAYILLHTDCTANMLLHLPLPALTALQLPPEGTSTLVFARNVERVNRLTGSIIQLLDDPVSCSLLLSDALTCCHRSKSVTSHEKSLKTIELQGWQD